jgi:hypothetical protein
MNKKYRKLLMLLNKVLYISSAAMLIAGALLAAAPQPAYATPVQDLQLNLSHVECVSGKVEVHFVLLNVPDGTTPGSLTFKMKINGGSENTYTIAGPSKHSGNVWHYYYYGSTNGKYDVTSASVVVSGVTVFLHNPDAYSDADNQCGPAPVSGCTDPTALNYNALATVDDGSCTYPPVPVPGCTDPTALNYNALATVDDGTCTYPPVPVPGCTDPTALNYNALATVDDGSCTYPPEPVPGCTDPKATNYNADATEDDGSCTYPPVPVPGCMDEAATNFNKDATVDDGSCTYPPVPVPGCTDPKATNYNADATEDDGTCTYPPVPVPGCTDEAATNFNKDATVDDGSCTYPPVPVPGCTDEAATNFNKDATVDDGSCTYPPGPVPGCTDPKATNYNADATEDNGSCTYRKITPLDPLGLQVDPFCNADGLMQWTVINPNTENITINYFTVDGGAHQPGFTVTPGEHNLVATALGTHTVVISYGDSSTVSLDYTIDVCPLQIPVTGGGLIIPVTGADETSKLGLGFGFGGMSLVGLALLLSALRKMYHL